MSLTLEEKKAVVSEVHQLAAGAQSAIAADYTGMSVAQMTEFRSQARAVDVHVRVVKNSLTKRAVEGTDFECLSDELVGPLVLVFSRDDPGSGARLIREYSKREHNLITKAIVLSGQLRAAGDLNKLADLPTLDQARAMLLGVLQAPATKLVRTLAEPGAQMVRLLAAYKDSQGA